MINLSIGITQSTGLKKMPQNKIEKVDKHKILYRLYANDDDYLQAIQSAEKRLKIPNATTRQYCDKIKVSNPKNKDFGKWIFPIIPSQLFFYNEIGKIQKYKKNWFLDEIDM